MDQFVSFLTGSVLAGSFLAAVLRVSTPYLFAALGGVVAERAGIPNIALEGQMLSAACTGVLVSGYSGSTTLGVAAGLVVAAALGVVLAACTLELRADPIIVGIGLNLLASGATAFTVFTLLGDKSGTSSLDSGTVARVTIPGLDAVPVLGDLLSGQNLLTYLALLALPAVWWWLYRSRSGHHVRAVGELPQAARTTGIRAHRVQYAAMAVSGALAGGGGVFLSMGAVSFFVNDMTAGRGYIALAAVFLGGVRPGGVFLAALGFGLGEALSIQLGQTLPTQAVTALPYVLTLVALAIFAARRRSRQAPGRRGSGRRSPRGPRVGGPAAPVGGAS